MNTTPEILTKAEFAALVNVKPSRLSHWIAEGKIGPEALIGEGRFARILVSVALAQVAARRDVGQALGNGSTVRLRHWAPPPPARPLSDTASAPMPTLLAAPAAGPDHSVLQPPRTDWLDPVEERIKQERLEEIARRNRVAAAKEAADAGRYVEAAAVRKEMSFIANGMMQVLEQALDTFATAIAARFQVPQRDAAHLLNGEFRTMRERSADALIRQAAALPRTVAATEATTSSQNGAIEINLDDN